MSVRDQSLIESMTKFTAIEAGQMFEKPCIKVGGKAFAAFHLNHLVFKLAGATREAALKEKGAQLWDPSSKDRPMKESIAIPEKSKFDELTYAKAAHLYVSTKA